MASATRRVRYRLSTQWLMVAILFVAIFAMAVRQPADTDTWWHLKSGQLTWESGQVLRSDPFSHTVAGQPWINHGWLVQLLLWSGYEALGLAGLSLLLATIVTGAMVLVYRQCPGKPYIAAFATLLAAVASSVIWSIRPQIFSFFLASLTAYLLAGYKRSSDSRWLWPLPLVVVLWVNCHGGFVIAFILMGCYLTGEILDRFAGETPPDRKLWPLALVILVSIPAILLNPNTAQMLTYAFQTVSIGPLQDFIQEWAVPDFHNLQFHPFIWLLLLLMAALGLSRRRADWTDLALVGVFGYMSLLAVRNTALFALVAAPVLAHHTIAVLNDLALLPRLSWLGAFTHTLPPAPPRRSQAAFNLVLLVLVLVAAGTKVGVDLARLRDPEIWGQGLPVRAADYLRSHELPGQMFNTYNWGGYLIWSLHPDNPVFVDGRTDLYALNSQVLEDYARVHWIRPGWQEILDVYPIGHVLTENSGLLDMMLARTPGWEEVFRDEIAVIYAREGKVP